MKGLLSPHANPKVDALQTLLLKVAFCYEEQFHSTTPNRTLESWKAAIAWKTKSAVYPNICPDMGCGFTWRMQLYKGYNSQETGLPLYRTGAWGLLQEESLTLRKQEQSLSQMQDPDSAATARLNLYV